jgi:hypothetical protein
MSRTLGLALSLVVCGPCVWGQDTLLTRLRIRADSLLRTWHDARSLADLADSLERERATAGRDTIAVGGLRIIVNPSPLPVRAAAERAWPLLDSLYGTVAADLVERPYIIRSFDPDTAVRRPILYVGMELPWDLDATSLTAVLLTTVPPPRFDPAIAQWLGASLRPTLRPLEEQREVFLQLVTAPSAAVRACFLGAIDRCKNVLQLDDTTDLLNRWYSTPAEREALVTESFSGYFERGATAPALLRCRQHMDDACTMLLRSLPPGTLPRPLANAARTVLVREALQLGGREAYSRLVAEPTAPMSQRLASAAGVGIDSLVVRWRNSVLDARPAPLTLPWWAGVAAFGWTAFFGFCALRSSRWRL